MAQVRFYRGLRANYSEVTHIDGLFFATDTFEIILNGEAFGGQDLGLEANKVVKNISVNETDPTILDVLYTDSSTSTITIPTGEYESAIADKELGMPNAVGGISAGTKVSALEGKTQSEMWDELLFPTVLPTYVLPTASLAFKSFSATVEAGSAAPLASNFTPGYNPGAINLNGVKQDNRGGVQDVDSSFIYVGTPDVTVLPTTVPLGNTVYRYRAFYAEGPQPQDNKGNNVDSKLAAGSVDSPNRTLNGTYPWYATTANNTDLTKQALIAWNATAGTMTTPQFTVAAVGSGKQEMKFPRAISQLQMENTVSGKFEVVSTADWTMVEGEEDVNGLTVNYFTYTYSGDVRDAVKLIVKF